MSKSTRAELEIALARAETEWRRANDDLDKAKAKLAGANAGWDMIATDRRKVITAWDRTFADRRTADSDRRIPEADITALSQAVAARHKAYLDLSNAETGRGAAEARLNAATSERDKATAALEELGPEQRKA